jgi:protein tyrosine phosphatase (PTP) superfamily phosphohydrolase (DUF442 family)
MNTLVESISDFLWLSERIATAGQPTIAQYPAIAAAGYRVVINLGLKDSPNALADEAEIASNLGLEYIHIPVAWNAPTREDFQIFVKAMEVHLQHKIFVHCAANKRVSVFMYLYQIHQGIDSMTAGKDLAKIWVPNLIWQNFINAIQSSIRGN